MTVLFTVHRSRFAIIFAVICSLFSILLFAPPALAATANNTKAKWFKSDYPSYIDCIESGAENEVKDCKFYRRGLETSLLSAADGALRGGKNSPPSVVGSIGSGIAALTGHPPAQTKEYLAYMSKKAGFINPAYAANEDKGGFGILTPIQKLWVATRNVAYLVTSLTLVVIGFMIMLRKKIDAQTVIGIQQALPKLVITLLLVTFSYAIAGFVIDMIYFLIYFSIKLLALNGVFRDPSGSAAIATITKSNVFNIGLASILGVKGGGDAGGVVHTAAEAVGNLSADLLSGTVGSFVGGAAGGLIAQPIATVVFTVAILFAVFKLFFSLLMAYIQIIILTILGPLQLMLNAMPGSDAFSKWFRNLLANALAFPAAALMLVFAAALTSQSGELWDISPDIGFARQGEGVKWLPPLIFGEGGAFSTTDPVTSVLALFGIGILLMTPKVVDMVKEWVQAPEFKYGSAIGEAVGFGWSPVRRGWQAGVDIGREERRFREQARIWGYQGTPYQPVKEGQQPSRWVDWAGRLGAFGRRVSGLQ